MKVKSIFLLLACLSIGQISAYAADHNDASELPSRCELTRIPRRSSLNAGEFSNQKTNTQFDVKRNTRSTVTTDGTSGPNEIYGWNAYSNVENNRYGLYRLNGKEGIKKVWEDAFFYEISGIGPDNGYYKDGKIIGQCVDKFGSTIFDMQRVTYDFKTGEVEGNKDITDQTPFDRMTYDPTHNVVYATIKDRGRDKPATWVVCEEEDWNNYKELAIIKPGLSSLCYNVPEGACYAIDLNKDFIRIEEDGTKTIISHIDFDFEPGYFSGLVYSPSENLYYASPQREEESFLMTITPTGEWDVYCQLPGNNQINFMLTPDFGQLDNEAPMRPQILSIDFNPIEYYGVINYSLPTELVNGFKIEEPIELHVYVDGDEYSVYTGYKPGEIVQAEFDDLDTGLHYISAYASCNGHKSQDTVCSQYMGNDTPKSPTNVILTETNVSWEAVTGGIHDAYVDLDAIVYSVFINGKEYGTTKDTTLAIELPEDELQVFTASVFAEANGMRSGAGISNNIVYGKAISLPMHILPTPEQAQMCRYLDNNGDGFTWRFDEYYGSFICEYSFPDVENDDWLVMPPFHVDSTTRKCTLSFLVANYHTDYPDERLEVYLGTIDEKDNYINEKEILAPFTPDTFLAYGYQKVEVEFEIPESGSNYIGFHWISEPDMAGMEIKDISVIASQGSGIEYIETLTGVKGICGGIQIDSLAGARLVISSLEGKKIVTDTVDSDSVFYPMESGLYIVNIDGQSIKVMVK